MNRCEDRDHKNDTLLNHFFSGHEPICGVEVDWLVVADEDQLIDFISDFFG